MTKEQHDKEVDKLWEIEKELIRSIAEAGIPELQDTFTKWQEQRNVCNEGLLMWIEKINEKRG